MAAARDYGREIVPGLAFAPRHQVIAEAQGHSLPNNQPAPQPPALAISQHRVSITEWVRVYLSDDGLAAMQRELLVDPRRGDIIPGCGGLRKLRVIDPRRSKGKRGGARVIYLHVAEADVVYLMDIYSKDEQEDLTADQKRILKRLVDETKRAAILAASALKERPRRSRPGTASRYSRLKTGMEEAIRHARGEIFLKATVVQIPDPPPDIRPEELTRLRADNRMSQEIFARVMNVPIGTVRSWEVGTQRPSRAALRLIQIFRQNSSGVLEAIGMSAAQAQGRPQARPPRTRPKPRTPPAGKTAT